MSNYNKVKIVTFSFLKLNSNDNNIDEYKSK